MATSFNTKSSDARNKFSESSCKVSSASKRKASITSVAEMLRNAKMKIVETSENSGVSERKIPLKSESDYKEPIIYDEYLEHGIPDMLLEGLGLNSAGEQETPNGIEEEKEEDSLKANCDDSDAKTVDSAAFKMLTPSSMLLSSGAFHPDALQDDTPEASEVLPHSGEQNNSGKSSVSWQNRSRPSYSISPKQTLRGSRRNGKPASDPAQKSRPGVDHPKASPETIKKTGVLPHYAIKKGGVMYEYTPSGTVLASIIRDTGAPGKSCDYADPSLGRVLQRNSAHADPASLPSEYSDDCGFNAANVDNLLEDLFKEMTSMRQKLSSMKDELRRVGVKTDIKTDVQHTKEQFNKATEVSLRIQKLYADHVDMLGRVEKTGRTDRVDMTKDDG